ARFLFLRALAASAGAAAARTKAREMADTISLTASDAMDASFHRVVVPSLIQPVRRHKGGWWCIQSQLGVGIFRPAWVRRASNAIAAPTGWGLTGMNCAHGCITEWHCPRARKRGTVAAVSFPGFFHGQPVDDRKTQRLPPPA